MDKAKRCDYNIWQLPIKARWSGVMLPSHFRIWPKQISISLNKNEYGMWSGLRGYTGCMNYWVRW